MRTVRSSAIMKISAGITIVRIAKMEAEGGRAKLQARLTALKQLVEQL